MDAVDPGQMPALLVISGKSRSGKLEGTNFFLTQQGGFNRPALMMFMLLEKVINYKGKVEKTPKSLRLFWDSLDEILVGWTKLPAIRYVTDSFGEIILELKVSLPPKALFILLE